MKTEVVAWNEFPWQREEDKPTRANRMFVSVVPLAVMLLMPQEAHATGWETAKQAAQHITDYLAYGVIVYAGGCALFGHRNKALDFLFSCGIGTIIISHASDIENFFKSI